MKKTLTILFLLGIASPTFAEDAFVIGEIKPISEITQVTVQREATQNNTEVDLGVIEIELEQESEIEVTATTSSSTIEIASTTVVATTSTSSVEVGETEKNATETAELITETIELIPGSVVLELSAIAPVGQSASTTAQLGTDGLFDLIYTGFEEFVFKVFGW